MKLKSFFQNSLNNLAKLTWSILCYSIALVLAVVSGYFTVVFYTEDLDNYNFYAMAFMAVSLEVIKIIFSVGYPFINRKNRKSKGVILFILRVCFILSVLASMNFLLLGSDMTISPASKTIKMLYQNLPFLNIIPLKFSQFVGTASLTLLIEFLIIYLPIVAPIMFYEVSKQKLYSISKLDKIKEILVLVPEMFIDNMHSKVINYVNSKKIELENPDEDNEKVIPIKKISRPKLKLLNSINHVKVENNQNSDLDKGLEIEPNSKLEKQYKTASTPFTEKGTDNTNNSNQLIGEKSIKNSFTDKLTDVQNKSIVNSISSNDDNSPTLFHDKDTENIKMEEKQNLLKAIYRLSENNICPSVKQLTAETGDNKNIICSIKKCLEDSGIIKTEGTKTILLCSYPEALENLKGG